jgi:hypothetical protein
MSEPATKEDLKKGVGLMTKRLIALFSLMITMVLVGVFLWARYTRA